VPSGLRGAFRRKLSWQVARKMLEKADAPHFGEREPVANDEHLALLVAPDASRCLVSLSRSRRLTSLSCLTFAAEDVRR
jgi:hypothetical protein